MRHFLYYDTVFLDMNMCSISLYHYKCYMLYIDVSILKYILWDAPIISKKLTNYYQKLFYDVLFIKFYEIFLAQNIFFFFFFTIVLINY